MSKRVVITGIGLVTPIGRSHSFWENCIAGKVGTSQVENAVFTYANSFMGGQIKDFQMSHHYQENKLTTIGRGSQLLYDAMQQCLNQSNTNIDEIAALYVGTTMGEASLDESVDHYFKGCRVPQQLRERNEKQHLILDTLALMTKKAIPQYLVGNACSAGNYALSHAYDDIMSGRSNTVLAGGVEPFSAVSLLGFKRLNALSKNVCRPFSKDRDGMLVSEGAAILQLEELEHAKARNAIIISELTGIGLSSDAHHINIPHPEGSGLKIAIENALKDAKIEGSMIDYISLHGTGTQKNDSIEARVLNDLFDNKAPSASSIKSMIGHTMGASSAIEAAVCCLATQNNVVPPTVNFTEADPECAIDCIPNKARQLTVDYALNLSAGFGGTNAALIFKKYQ
ncbi:beta-ketoacyl-[acyl-carrier-protein] synthase family protein [Brochothrix thermosphacta]|uniref:beta-ketoacyl-[acyl-carrier-protein] synthase family protein n=1 Tax=Brochothrix thermosphacta TaxID=2756 RepID=UPI00083F9746|nr:beta-ketoacyl-[acyl-carrier-protein] synthase family protein [Brochothrix thermosphacta]ODJ59967.1 hypothetical protein BFR44_02670 [Brochothrix thermosphacta]